MIIEAEVHDPKGSPKNSVRKELARVFPKRRVLGSEIKGVTGSDAIVAQ